MNTNPARGLFHEMVRHGSRIRANRRISLLLLALLIGGLAGCVGVSGTATVESRSVPAEDARSAHVEVAMQPGNLQMRGGAAHLMDARFTYQPSTWKPTIDYKVIGGRGDLVVRQPHLQSVSHGHNTWQVEFSDRMPLDLEVTYGPGNATLSLETLKLNTLAISAGPGNLSIDAGSPSLKAFKVSVGPGNLSVNLIAPWKHNLTATIDGGIGNTTLRLPASVGVRVTMQGQGFVDAPDFAKVDDAYVNSAFGRSGVTLNVSLSAGIGNVVLMTGTS